MTFNIASLSQGNIFRAFPSAAQYFIMIRFVEHSDVVGPLRSLVPVIERSTIQSKPDDALLALGFTQTGLAVVGKWSADIAEHTAFREGAAARAPKLRQWGTSDPTNWLFGGPGRSHIDAVLTIASKNVTNAAHKYYSICQDLEAAGIEIVHVEQGGDLPPPNTGREHFGFLDGVAQPRVRNVHCTCAPEDCDCISFGEFAIGYPRESTRNSTFRAVVSNAWTFGGTFGVLTRFDQDVRQWRHAISALAVELSSCKIGRTPVSSDEVAALLMGRRQNGALLSNTIPWQTADNSDTGRNFDDDLLGTKTPRFSHVRKMSPPDRRVGSRNWHRILRRGVPFGPVLQNEDDDEQSRIPRGLLFNGFVSRIETQYEQLLHGWANDPDFPDPGSGPDPVIGTSDAPLSWRTADGRVIRKPFPACVTVRGSVYLFYPTLSALRHITNLDLSCAQQNWR